MRKVASYSLVDGGGGAMHRDVEAARKGNTGGSRGRESVSHGAFPARAWVEGGKRRGEGFAQRGGVRAAMPKKKKRDGSSMEARARVESQQSAGKGENKLCE